MLGQVATASSRAFCAACLRAQGSPPGTGAQSPGTVTAELEEAAAAAAAILDERSAG